MRKMKTFGWLLCAAMFAMTSCSKDDDNGGDAVLVEDGMYIVGAGTPLAALNDNGKMYDGRNEAKSNALRPGMYEIYMTVKAGADGFNIIEKAGAVETTYGPAMVETVTLDGADYQITGTIQRGTFAANATKFTVPTDGLYHIVIDKAQMVIAIIPVTKWGVSGSSSGDIDLPLNGAFNATSMEFVGNNIAMNKGIFKLRYDGGWKVALSGDTIKVNTNYGGTLDAVVAGGADFIMTSALRGKYTVSIKWTLAKGNVITLAKTGDIAEVNYTDYTYGLIGDAFNKADGTVNGWGDADNFGNQKPVKLGSVYSWTWDNVVFLGTGGFKIRQQMAAGVGVWSGKNFGYPALTMNGAAAGNFAAADGGSDANFTCTVAGTYKLVLAIDASTEAYTLTATKY